MLGTSMHQLVSESGLDELSLLLQLPGQVSTTFDHTRWEEVQRATTLPSKFQGPTSLAVRHASLEVTTSYTAADLVDGGHVGDCWPTSESLDEPPDVRVKILEVAPPMAATSSPAANIVTSCEDGSCVPTWELVLQMLKDLLQTLHRQREEMKAFSKKQHEAYRAFPATVATTATPTTQAPTQRLESLPWRRFRHQGNPSARRCCSDHCQRANIVCYHATVAADL
ncbi:unnamed protein product [Linum trigynum]|uniref:Uncharacterized protein n=1 Tax=Linum trigynum TaxID=586398 RepID=A0AAV2FV03_9ROSI